LSIKWGEGATERCDVDYTLPARAKGHKADTYQQVRTRCKAPTLTTISNKAH
jgi:outer membrane usher protein FimD/PapC